MRNKIHSFLKKALFVVIIVSQTKAIYCQRPVPYMWVSKDECARREMWFKTGKLAGSSFSKADILNQILQKTQPAATHVLSYIYPSKSFDQLISLMIKDNNNAAPIGLKVYFGAHDINVEPDNVSMTGIPDKQIELIYAPTDGTWNETGNYYILGPDGQPHKISKGTDAAAIKTAWVNNYQANEVNPKNYTGLVSTLEANATENLNDDGNYTDTKSILYCFADFTDFIQTERNYQDNNNVTNPGHIVIDQIEVNFASYTDAGIGVKTSLFGPTAFKNRLHIIFGFRRNNMPFAIDDASDFSGRLNNRAASACAGMAIRTKSGGGVMMFKPKTGGGGDNGQLCPPYNCP